RRRTRCGGCDGFLDQLRTGVDRALHLRSHQRLAVEPRAVAHFDVGGEDDCVCRGDDLGGDRRGTGGALRLDGDRVAGARGRLFEGLRSHVGMRDSRGTRCDGDELLSPSTSLLPMATTAWESGALASASRKEAWTRRRARAARMVMCS